MKFNNIDEINDYVNSISFVELSKKFEQHNKFSIEGEIMLSIEKLEDPLPFKVIIYPYYPLRNYASESIKFINHDLIKYNHVMEDGVICIHTQHSPNLKEKIIMDFNSLKNWVVKYYINEENDSHYEHLISNPKPVDDKYAAYLFLESDYKFKQKQFGIAKVSSSSTGIYNGKIIRNYLLQSIEIDNKDIIEFNWNGIHHNKDHKELKSGIFYFSKDSPAKFDKFIFSNWIELKHTFSSDFLDFLHRFEKANIKSHKNKIIPVFLGYYINKEEIHWQVLLLKIGEFPIEGTPVIHEGKKTGQWKTTILNSEIIWGISRNCSYKYFFGRGILSNSLVDGKILIIGLGAIGSMVSKTLVQGGLKEIHLVDYDTKEPENVCRSEYTFSNGMTDKSMELYGVLSSISPHVKIETLKDNYFNMVTKGMHNDKENDKLLDTFFNSYDYIFDCSTDNDLMYILNSRKLTSKLINFSITNHASSLVCGIHPGIYEFVNHQFNEILDNDTDDLYNPTGCWSPTFKANYNDINVLVQYAIKQINLMSKNDSFYNFTLETKEEDCFEIKIKKY